MSLSENLIQIGNNTAEIKSEIEALLTYANTTTGDTDTRLGEAVRKLVEGYGSGGGGTEYKLMANGSAQTFGSLTFSEDIKKVTFDFTQSTSIGQTACNTLRFLNSDGAVADVFFPSSNFSGYGNDFFRSYTNVNEVNIHNMEYRGNYSILRWFYLGDNRPVKVTGLYLNNVPGDGTNGAFSAQSQLYDVYWTGNLVQSAVFNGLSGLNDDSIDRFIDCMIDTTEGLTLTLSNATTKSRFTTPERLARITAKGWTVV